MKERTTLQKGKQYTMLDFVRIPMKACPGCATAIAITRILTALIPALMTLSTAYFVNTSIAIFNQERPFTAIVLPMVCYMLIIVYIYMKNAIIFNFINIRYDMKIFRYFRSELIDKRAKLKYEHVENNDTWELVNRTCENALGSIATGFNGVLDIIDLIINIFSILIILFTQVWWAALIILSFFIPFALLSVLGGKELYVADKEAKKHSRRAKYYAKVLSERENVEERSVFSYSNALNDSWHDLYEKSRKINLKADLKWYILGRIASIVTLVFTLIIIIILLLPLRSGELSIGLFTGILTALMQLVETVSWRLSYVTSQFTLNLQYLKDLTKVMSLAEQEGAFDLPADHEGIELESIRFENVFFKYPETDRYILKNFSVDIEENKHYAFVGVNGAGKTTITKLLTGMYDNYEGNIYINNRNIREIPLAELKSFFSVVYQDFAKYYVSVMDNIYLGNTRKFAEGKCDDENVMHLLERIELKEAIEELPQGKNTYLGKIKADSSDLSGGQWQRLAITRALYNPAKVRILDEPTAALDPVAESKIYKLFGDISKETTTIFITHRLGAARLADEIIVLSEGTVTEKGTHNELVGRHGVYAEMFESQRSWYQYE